MRGYDTYRKTQPAAFSRVDILLAAYDGVTTRIKEAAGLIAKGDYDAAQIVLVRAQRIIIELHSGLDMRHGTIPENVRKLYLFILSCIGLGDELKLDAALQVLGTLRSAISSIRSEAVELENSGAIKAVEEERVIQNAVA